MKSISRFVIVVGLLLAGACVDVSQAQKVLPPDTVGKAVGKVKFEARCEADHFRKLLLVVDDANYYMVQSGGVNLKDFGIPGKFWIKGVTIDSDAGRRMLKQVPIKYNNHIVQILDVQSERKRNGYESGARVLAEGDGL